MSCDYALKFACEVRRNVPEDKLSVLVGYKSLVDFAVNELRKSDPAMPKETILNCEVMLSQKRPDGIVKQVPMTIGQLAAMVEPIAQYRNHCVECRANVAARSFGCFAKINYPIRAEVEEWLLSRLPEDIKNPGLVLLFQCLSDLKIDGRAVDELRPNLFERKSAFVRRWEEPSGQKRVTSSQIIQMLAFSGNISPLQATLYTEMLGLQTVLSDPHPPSSNIEQFKTLMCAIVMSGRLNAGINVDS